MIGLARELLFKERRRLQLVGVGLVGGQGRLAEGQRIEDASLDVLGVLGDQRLHRLLVGHDAGPLIAGRGVAIQLVHRRQVSLLALGAAAAGLGRVHGRPSGDERLRRAVPAERVAPPAHRDAPVRHHAARVLLQHTVERLARRGEPERVQQRDAAVELVGHRRSTRGGELHRTQPAGRRAVVVRRRLRHRWCLRGLCPSRSRQHGGHGDNSNDHASHQWASLLTAHLGNRERPAEPDTARPGVFRHYRPADRLTTRRSGPSLP